MQDQLAPLYDLVHFFVPAAQTASALKNSEELGLLFFSTDNVTLEGETGTLISLAKPFGHQIAVNWGAKDDFTNATGLNVTPLSPEEKATLSNTGDHRIDARTEAYRIDG